MVLGDAIDTSNADSLDATCSAAIDGSPSVHGIGDPRFKYVVGGKEREKLPSSLGKSCLGLARLSFVFWSKAFQVHCRFHWSPVSSKLESFKPLLRLVSTGVAVLLFSLSCAGFKHVSASKDAFGGASSFGCICFLGCCFGVLLALAELNWGLFYFFFGFLRYRIGHAVLFAVSGIIIALIGKDLDDQCSCKSYVILIVEGAACVGMAALHLFGVFVFGNNTKPSAPPSRGSTALVIPPLPKQPPHSAKTDSTAFEPIAHAPPSTTARAAGSSSNDPNRPAWMNP